MAIKTNNRKIICKVVKPAHLYEAYDIQSNIEYTHEITDQRKKEAFKENKYLLRKENTSGKIYWSMIDPKTIDLDKIKKEDLTLAELKELYEGIFEDDDDDAIRKYVQNSMHLKPKDLLLSELDWKYLIRSGVRGKNIMVTGFHGAGKTKCAHALKAALKRPFIEFNFGATQDPRGAIIGNTHSKDGSTVFVPSRFAMAIQKPYAVILLDEISRAHPEVWNILMSVVDENQRYLALDESKDCDVIRVAEGVTFIATANIGAQYTSTRQMDKAFVDRWIKFEMPVLSKKQEEDLLMMRYPNLNTSIISAIAATADYTRKDVAKEKSNFATIISTRMTLEWAGLCIDGFSLRQAAKVVVYPDFSRDGGVESERTKIKQQIQKNKDMMDDNIATETEDDDKDLFDTSVDDDL